MQTFSGMNYLRIDIASNFGLDKKDWDERIAWVHSHEDELERLMPAAEEPALYFAGVQAYRKAQKGEPTGYPISLDAASSGLQLLACLTGCRKSALLCGVVSTGHREDAYTNIYRAMREILDSGDLSRQPGDTAVIPGSTITREDAKRAIMTSLYSSTQIPKQVFGEGEQYQVFLQTMEERAPGAWELNQALQGLWQPYALSHNWVLPDNFHANVPVESNINRFVQFMDAPVAITLNVNAGTREGRSISPNLIHSVDGMIVREMHRRCDYDLGMMERVLKLLKIEGEGGTRERTGDDHMVLKLWEHYQRSGFLSARILEHLRAENMGHVDMERIRALVFSMPEKPFKVISIHDCFRCLPNHGNDLRRQYNNLLAEIAESELLSYLASQVTGKPITVNKLGNLGAEIREADYALC